MNGQERTEVLAGKLVSDPAFPQQMLYALVWD